jgi:hypothetical protein
VRRAEDDRKDVIVAILSERDGRRPAAHRLRRPPDHGPLHPPTRGAGGGGAQGPAPPR